MSDSNRNVDASLKRYVTTDAQRAYIDAVIEHGSNRKAADALGINHSLIARTIAAARRLAAVSPRGTDGFVPREITTHYGADGDETGSTLKEAPAPWADGCELNLRTHHLFPYRAARLLGGDEHQ